MAFGDYYGSFNVSMLTQKRGLAGGTNSELVKAKGKHLSNRLIINRQKE
jgi:hypothetical protein